MPIEFDGPNSKVSADKIQGQTGTTVTIESGHSLSGSGASLTNLPAANLTGTIAGARLPDPLPAISGVSLTNLPGEKRNYIIDGDFTQWPDGTTAATPSNNGYTSALMAASYSNDGTVTYERSTDVPTAAESGHSSTYSYLAKCTGTDAAIGAGQHSRIKYNMTGSDFTALDAQQVTISFWAKTSAQNSGHTYWLKFLNETYDRHYVTPFVPTSSWTQFTHTLTLDTGGSWLLTEGTVGLRIEWVLAGGSDFDDATLETWGAGAELWVNGSTMSNFLDHTSNEFYLSQVGLYLGSTAPTFSSPPIATVKDQVDYYVQRFDYDSATDAVVSRGSVASTTRVETLIFLKRTMRRVPTMTSSAAATFKASDVNTVSVGTILLLTEIMDSQFKFNVTAGGASFSAARAGYISRDGADTTWIMADSRH